jgi:hypothetical protein
MQTPDGGWITDYKDGKPVGLANVVCARSGSILYAGPTLWQSSSRSQNGGGMLANRDVFMEAL